MTVTQHLKTEELARRLSIHPETLRRYAARGELHPVRLGRDLLWPVDEVNRWLESKVDNRNVVRLTRASATRRSA